MPSRFPTLAIVGATGAVGREALSLLADRGHPSASLLPVASDRSVGELIPYGDRGSVRVGPIEVEELARADLVLLAASARVARELAPKLVQRGCPVVDNSSAFRLDPGVPLVVPEVNVEAIQSDTRLVANPNCSTILLLVALEPLRRAFGIERVVVSTYQAVSGAGRAAMGELEDQSRAVLAGREAQPRLFPEPCAFNVFPHESPIDPASGMNEEELKLIRETGRIWNEPDVSIVPSCARVPVFRSHSQSVLVTLREPASEEELRSRFTDAAGLELLDSRERGEFPTSLRATGTDPVLVGRLRPAPGDPPDGARRFRSFCLWLSGDQLRKGAALNALQIGDRLLHASDG